MRPLSRPRREEAVRSVAALVGLAIAAIGVTLAALAIVATWRMR